MAELYADLDDKVLEIEADELRERNRELEAKVENLSQEHIIKVEMLQKRIDLLLKEKKILEENISSLYETAVNELARKETMNTELQNQINALQGRFRKQAKIWQKTSKFWLFV